jgi:hypothetical protein
MDDKKNKSKSIGFVINPRRVLIVLLSISLLLVILHVGLQYSKFNGGPDKLLFFSNIFNVGEESSVSTWFSQFILFASALICGFVAFAKSKLKEKYHIQWWIVSAVFLLLSIDEVAVIHEQLISIIERNISGISAWYIYAALAVGVVAIFLLKFWWFLPRKTKYLLVGAVFIYLFGAVFMDVFGGKYVNQGFFHEGFIVGMEELFEMIGACLFVYIFLDYVMAQKLSISLRTDDTPKLT